MSNDTRSNGVSVVLDPARLRYWLTRIVVVLIATTFAAQLLKSKDKLDALSRFFDSNVKVNIPTGYKILMLTACALVVLAIARVASHQGDRWTREWHWLAVFVGLLAFDETAAVHQSLSESLDKRLDLGGPLHFSWILIYLPIAVAGVALLWRFLMALPRATKRGFLLGGLLFIGGAAGIELVKGTLADKYGEESLRFNLAAAFSDSLEEIGLAVFLVAAVTALWARTSGFGFRPPD